jgi:hypothetical protein
MNDMRNKMLSTTMLVMFFAFTCTANADSIRNGNWWTQIPPIQKMSYTIGFMDGQIYAQLMFTAALLHGAGDPKTGKFDANRMDVAKEIERYTKVDFNRDFVNLTTGQLVAGLDKIYSDYRNMRIEVSDAVLVVLRSIEGMPDDEIEKLLQNKRKAAAE